MSAASLPTSAILCEPFAGLQAQALGLAETAGLLPALRSLRPRGLWRHLAPRWWPRPLAAIAPDALADLPELLIGCGGKAAAVLSALRRPIRVIVQHPRLSPERFDLVVAARHDRLAGRNVIVTRTALHRVTPEKLAAAAEAWRERLESLPRPLVAVLVGGSNGRFRFEAAEAAALGQQLAGMIQADRVGIALTPSRRTAPAAVAQLVAALQPHGAFIWDRSGDNPYLGLLALADAIVVTGDSVSMVSEAVASAAPVLVAALPGRSRRIADFLAGLEAERRIRRYRGRLELWDTAPLNDTPAAAAEMRHRLGF